MSIIETEPMLDDEMLGNYEEAYGWEVENMSNKAISKMLRLHSVNYYEENGHIYADNGGRVLFDRVIDLTGYSRLNLLAWLGY
jgi:hypothetical protein